MVQDQKRQLSAELDLRRLIVNLDNTATLLYIAYNALSGNKVQSRVSGLQKRLDDLCKKSQTAMSGISNNTMSVIKQLPLVYGMLVQGKAAAATQLLASCSKYAKKMADVSEELALGFEKMGDEAQAALEDSQGVYADDLQKQKEIKKQINEMRGKQENLKKKSMELQGTIQEMEEKYAEAQRREEKAEKNAMILSIVNICTSTLTLGLSAYSEKAKAQAELEKAEQELAAIEAEMPGEDEAAKRTHAERKGATLQKITELKNKVAEAEKSVANKKQLVAAAQATLQGLSEQIAKERNEMKDTLEKAQETTAELFKLKLDMQKENREIAGEMAEIAEMLKGQEETLISADKAVEMLKLAIRCLGNIVVAFTEAALFWRNIEQGCNNLQDGAFMTQVATFSEFDSELQSLMYGSDDFKRTLLVYMATWVALHSTSVDYFTASRAIGEKVDSYISRNLFEKEAYEEAARLADEIINSMQMEQNAIDESNEMIEKIRMGQ